MASTAARTPTGGRTAATVWPVPPGTPPGVLVAFIPRSTSGAPERPSQEQPACQRSMVMSALQHAISLMRSGRCDASAVALCPASRPPSRKICSWTARDSSPAMMDMGGADVLVVDRPAGAHGACVQRWKRGGGEVLRGLGGRPAPGNGDGDRVVHEYPAERELRERGARRNEGTQRLDGERGRVEGHAREGLADIE